MARKTHSPEEVLEALRRLSEAFLNYFNDQTEQHWQQLCWAAGVGMGASVAVRSEQGPHPRECAQLARYAGQLLRLKDLPGALEQTEQEVKAACAAAPFTYVENNQQLVDDLKVLEAAMPLWFVMLLRDEA